MAYEIPGKMRGTMRAAADLRTLQFRFCVVNSSGLIAQNTVAGGDVEGVIQNKPNTNDPVTVMVDGVSKVVGGAAVAQGAKIMSDSVGRAVTATSTNKGLGTALTACANAGEIISVELKDIGTQ